MHVITGLGAGGAERMLTRIATLDHGGVRQTVVSLSDAGVQGAVLRAAGVEVYCLGMRQGMLSFRAVLRLILLLRRERPDVVMTWLYHADLLGLIASEISGVGRVVWNVRCSDVDFSLYGRSTRWVVSLLARLSARPAAVATNSLSGRRAHEALGYHPRHWIHLANGFDLDTWHPDSGDRQSVRSELGIEADEIIVGLVARVDPLKDHVTFLAAAKSIASSFPRVRFVLLGRGTWQLPIAPALLGRMILLGERADVPRLMRSLDILVLSSSSEGFPNVVGEAMATAVACVVTDVGDAALIVGDTGLVVPPSSPAALATAVLALATESSEERQTRGARARRRIAEYWSLEAAAAAYRIAWETAAAS